MLETPISIRHVVFNIVVLNIRTVKAIRKGRIRLPKFISWNEEDYEWLVSEEENVILDLLNEASRSRFNLRVSEHVDLMSTTTAMNYLMDPRTSDLYAELIDISLSMFLTARAHAVLPSKFGPQKIKMRKHDTCSFQDFVEANIMVEQESRSFLKASLNGAKQLLYSIKVAVDDGSLDEEHLAALKSKLLALQENYPDAWEAIYGDARDLFDPDKKEWW